jgi:putative transcriptional regulator
MEKLVLNRIKVVLAEKSMSNKALAQGLNKTEATVSQWCTNMKQPSLETFFQIAKFLDVDLRELFVSTKSIK